MAVEEAGARDRSWGAEGNREWASGGGGGGGG